MPLRLPHQLSYIWKFPGVQEAEYEEYCKPANLWSVYLINGLFAIGMAMFLIVDYYREVRYTVVFNVRLSYLVMSLLLIFIARSFPWKPRHVSVLMIYSMASLTAFSMLLAHYGNMPSFFLTNIMVIVLLGTSTMCGLPFRYIIPLNTALLLSFYVFAEQIHPDPFYKTQYANIVLIYISAFVASILLELRRRQSFLRYEDVIRQNKRIEELNEQKNTIISVLSHDLASPIHSLSGLLQLQELGAITEGEMKPHLTDIRKRLESVTTLVYGLVRWSKSQLEGIIPEKRAVDIERILHDLAELFRPVAGDKSVGLTIDAEPRMLAFCDEEMTRIALRNLISNAVKFSPPEGLVRVSAQRHNGNIRLRVTNQGAPIDQLALKNMFSYHVTSRVGTAGEKGTGLGLAMSSYFVKASGGEIYLEEDPKGQTITFVVELPVAGD